MWPEEIEWAVKQFNKFLPKTVKTCIDVGSEDEQYRTQLQPWNNFIYDYFSSKKIKINTMDLDPKKKPDYVHDITNPTNDIGKFDVVLATHLLEHVPILRLGDVAVNLEQLVAKKGYLLVSVPNSYPYHARPIDNGWRPVTKELVKLFKGKILASSTIEVEHNSLKYKNHPLNKASCALLRYD